MEFSGKIISVSIKTKQQGRVMLFDSKVTIIILAPQRMTAPSIPRRRKKVMEPTGSPLRSSSAEAPLFITINVMAQLTYTVQRERQGYSRLTVSSVSWYGSPMSICLPVLPRLRFHPAECRKGNDSISVEKLLWVRTYHKTGCCKCSPRLINTVSVPARRGERAQKRSHLDLGHRVEKHMILRASYKEESFPSLSIQAHCHMLTME